MQDKTKCNSITELKPKHNTNKKDLKANIQAVSNQTK